MMKHLFKLWAIAFFCIVLSSCDSSKNNNTKEKTVDTLKANTAIDTSKNKTSLITERPAIINIVDTLAPKKIVVCIKDSAATFDRIGIKLAKIYGLKLAEVLKKNGLTMASAPMAWYTTFKAPYFFEAGVAVSQAPTKLLHNAFVKELHTDSVVVAHFYGPYNLLPQGYTALKEWMKDAHKTPSGNPYEIYIGDPIDKDGKPVEPYKVRTDIIYPRK